MGKNGGHGWQNMGAIDPQIATINHLYILQLLSIFRNGRIISTWGSSDHRHHHHHHHYYHDDTFVGDILSITL